MERYLVGGAVRDRLLGLEPKERDWLITGATPEQLLARGYRQIGRDFPVFLHPETSEEHALPRGVDRDRSALEADLCRRDLTINAMAMDAAGNLIDPCGGKDDLQARLLRHTPHFKDDPIRVLRLARLAARYHHLGFHVADETVDLVQQMAAAGQLNDQVPERVWSEIARALEGPSAHVFFEILRTLDALGPILPELDALFGIPQPARYHPEIDTGIHTLMVLEQACQLTADPSVRFAALTHDLGKAETPRDEWPGHRGHTERGVSVIRRLSARLRVPNAWRDLACLVARYHTHCHRLAELRASTVLRMLEAMDGFRRPERVRDFAIACEADARGRKGQENRPFPERALLLSTLEASRDVRLENAAEHPPRAIARIIRESRLERIQQVLQRHKRSC
jgi:tRNA nucleotidyltransferase (CCA-adding enzyme)